jgi:hypothetical protein
VAPTAHHGQVTERHLIRAGIAGEGTNIDIPQL